MPEKHGNSLFGSYGDRRERELWPTLSPHFGMYEPFWATYVLPLRQQSGRYIRPDVDERLELMAQENYKCFLSLGNALKNVENAEHPEVAYTHLQNAANSASATVGYFVDFAAKTVGRGEEIRTDELTALAKRVARYRNFIHEGAVALVKVEGVFFIPKPDKLDTYRRWSRLQEPDMADFTPVLDDLRSEFRNLCVLLEAAWKQMLALAPDIGESEAYRGFRSVRAEIVRHECPIVCSSNVQEEGPAMRKRVRQR